MKKLLSVFITAAFMLLLTSCDSPKATQEPYNLGTIFYMLTTRTGSFPTLSPSIRTERLLSTSQIPTISSRPTCGRTGTIFPRRETAGLSAG